MIIRTATLTIVARDFPKIRESVERIVNAHHGFVRQLETAGHEGSARSLGATVMVPSQDLAVVLLEMRALGSVEEEKQGGEEVTQQHADLVARLANSRNTEKRLTEVLATRTGKLSDVLEVEQAISRVREEIESMDSELRSMDKRIQYATITLRVAEEFKAQIDNHAPSVSTRLWNASVDGIDNLVDMVLGITEFALRGFPVILFWALLLFFPARWAWRTAKAHGHLQ